MRTILRYSTLEMSTYGIKVLIVRSISRQYRWRFESVSSLGPEKRDYMQRAISFASGQGKEAIH
jgi:hypothetical protein